LRGLYAVSELLVIIIDVLVNEALTSWTVAHVGTAIAETHGRRAAGRGYIQANELCTINTRLWKHERVAGAHR